MSYPDLEMFNRSMGNALIADNDRLRAELAEAKAIIGVTDDTIQRVHAELATKEARIAKLQDDVAHLCGKMAEKLTDNDALRKELAEAKAALDVYDRTFPKKSELELHAALEAANARVAELEAAGNRIGDTAINSILDGMGTLACAERAEARIAELEEQLQECWQRNLKLSNTTTVRAERAEAECKALREALDWIYGFLAYVDSYHSRMIRDKVLAALNPSEAKQK